MVTGAGPVDYANTPTATAQRSAKALALARLAWRTGLTVDDVDRMPDQTRRAFVRAAGHKTASETTWREAAARLARMWEASRDPEQAQLAPVQDLSEHRGRWTDNALQAPVNAPTAPAGAVRASAPPVPPHEAPKGWTEACALGPLPGGEACAECGQPAHVRTLDVDRCPDHPPRRGEWGHQLDYAPNPRVSCAPGRCYCGRHTAPEASS